MYNFAGWVLFSQYANPLFKNDLILLISNDVQEIELILGLECRENSVICYPNSVCIPIIFNTVFSGFKWVGKNASSPSRQTTF